MRTRSTNARISELGRWLKKNKTAEFKDFHAETGGTRSQYYKMRRKFGVANKNPNISTGLLKALAKKKKMSVVEKPVKPVKQVEQEPLFAPDEKVVEGVTPDFIWYEIDILQRKLSEIQSRLSHVVKVSQARDAEQKKMLRDLISENTELRVNSNSLRQQVSELTEMINGSPV